ncbi:MAG: hypothetical protein ACR2J8_05730, partial [Thermomicrobiales bacterium]
MDHQSFDRLARLLGDATSRRAGIRAALATLLSTGVASRADAARSTDGGYGPCNKGNKKGNICGSNKDCCTNYCVKGWCKAKDAGFSCNSNRECAENLQCLNGICTGCDASN